MIFVESPEDRRIPGLFVSYTESTRADEHVGICRGCPRLRLANITSLRCLHGFGFPSRTGALDVNKDTNDFDMKSIDMGTGSDGCWSFEVVPRTTAGAKAGYDRLHAGSESRRLPCFSTRHGPRTERDEVLQANELRRVDGIWVPQLAHDEDLEDTKLNRRPTRVLEVDNHASVADSDFRSNG